MSSFRGFRDFGAFRRRQQHIPWGGGFGPLAGYQKVAFIGDSITLGTAATIPATQGFVGLLTAANPGATMYNLGVAGTKASDGAVSYPAWLTTHSPDLTVIGYGVNEALGSVAVSTYITNMQTICAAAKAAGSDIAIFCEPAQNSADLTPYVAAAKAIATSYNAVFVVDIFTRWGTYAAGLASGFQSGDGIHPSNLGHADISTAFTAAVKTVTRARPVTPYGVGLAPVGWWKADAITYYTSGTTATVWGDSSGNGWALQKVAAPTAPTWSTANFSTGAINFPAGAPLENSAWSGAASATAQTVFVVYKTAASPAANAIIYCPTNQAAEIQEFSSTVYNVVSSGNNGKSATVDAAKHVHEIVFDGSQSGNAGRLTVWREGVAQTLVFTGTIPASVASTTGVGIGDIAGGAAPYNGEVAEVLVYNTALSAANRSTIRVALGAKYSISVTP